MKNLTVLFCIFSVLLSIASCKKKTEVLPPVIEILSPAENELFILPATIRVKLHIASDQALTVVRISIENENQVPLSTPVFIYPDSDQLDFEEDLYIRKLPEGTSGPTYLRVKAENGGAQSNKFLQLQFVGPELISKGFYLITSPGANQTKVQVFDTTFVSADFVVLPNEFSEAAVSIIYDMLYISTKSPDKLQAFRFQSSEPAWEMEALMPVPEFYNLNLSDRLLYIGTGNGRVLGFNADNGNTQFTSPPVYDSVPGQIGVFEDYVMADYKSRIGPERGWLVFYKETAALVRKRQSQLSVQSFYPALSKNNALVFGNIGLLGVIQYYDIENDNPLISLNFTTGTIGASCPMEAGYFLIAVGKDIWQFDETQQSVKLLNQTEEEVVDLQYDLASRQIYVATAHRLSIYNATADTLVAEFESAATIRAVRLRLGYPDE